MRHSTVVETICAKLADRGERPAMLSRDERGEWACTTYRDLDERVRRAALGLLALGVQPGDRIALFGDSAPGWTIADLAIACAGATSVPLHPLSTSTEVGHALRHSDASGAIVQTPEQLALVRESAPPAGSVAWALTFEAAAAGVEMCLEDLCALGDRCTRALPMVGPQDRYTILYTSGSTGAPKGCVHAHANYAAAISLTAALGAVAERDLSYLHLPLAHVFGREVQNLTLAVGGCLAYSGGDRGRIFEELRELGPTFFASVPRIYEHAYAEALSLLAERGETLDPGQIASALDARLRGGQPCEGLELGPMQAVRAIFGGRLRTAWSGAAPIEYDVLRFLFACGVPIYEGYGLTETAAACTLGTAASVRLGRCGRALPGGVGVRVGADGEVLVSGPTLFSGYLHDADATRAALTDGALRTGDIGELDGDGFLRIEGRLKDIIVTANGKNVAPASWESAVQSSPLVERAVVVGDRRPYLIALVVPDPARAKAGAADELEGQVAEVVAAANAGRPSWEQVKRTALLDEPLTQQAGELTVTGKVRRTEIARSRQELIDQVYRDAPDPPRTPTEREPMSPSSTTPAQAANIAAIERFFAGISNREVKDVLALYVEDCEFTAPEPLPWGGTYRGHAGIEQLFANFMPYWREIEEHAESVISTDSEVMVVVRQRGVTRTGASYDGQLALHFEMKDGMALRGRGFADTSTVLQAVGAEPRHATETDR